MGNHKSSSILLLQMQTLYIYLYMYIQRKRFFWQYYGGSLQSAFVLSGQHKVRKPSTLFSVFFSDLARLCNGLLFVTTIIQFLLTAQLYHNKQTSSAHTPSAKHSFSEAVLKPGLVNAAETDGSTRYCKLAYISILTDVKRV